MTENIFKKHVGGTKEIELGGDNFILKPLGLEHISDMLEIQKSFSGMSEGSNKPEDMLKNLDDKGKKAIKKVIEDTLQKSYPEQFKQDPEAMQEFGLKYSMKLLPAIVTLNSAIAMTDDEKRKQGAIERLQNRPKE